jgi:hypothetical protein
VVCAWASHKFNVELWSILNRGRKVRFSTSPLWTIDVLRDFFKGIKKGRRERERERYVHLDVFLDSIS